MTQDEARHAKKMEQIMASIDEKLERIAKSLEEMEPTVYKIPKFDVPLNDPDINVPADRYLRTITAKDPDDVKDPAIDGEKSTKTRMSDYWRDCLSETFRP
jgi:hypothetical protein